VDDYNEVQGLKNIYAIGDIAFMKTENCPKGHPMLAPVAIQQGQLLARNLVRAEKGDAIKGFEYADKGAMATVGRNRAVVDMPKFTMGGFAAWSIWMFVHLLSIIGFRNRLVVLSNWIWNYFTYDRGTRLIIRTFVRDKSYNQGESL
jgi:NADH dehydrogenase